MSYRVDRFAQEDVADLEKDLITSRIGKGSGYSFDGNNDYIEFQNIGFGLGDFSLCFDLEHNNVPSALEIISSQPSGNNRWLFQVLDDQYRLNIVDGSGTSNNYIFSADISTGKRCVVLAVDRDDSAVLYINNVRITSLSVAGTSAVDLGAGNANPRRIGASSSSFDGNIWRVQLFSKFLQPEEVKLVSHGQYIQSGLALDFNHRGAAPGVWADSLSAKNGTVNGATLINPMPLHADAFVSLTNLPTSSAGLAAGRVWNDGGTLKVV